MWSLLSLPTLSHCFTPPVYSNWTPHQWVFMFFTFSLINTWHTHLVPVLYLFWVYTAHTVTKTSTLHLNVEVLFTLTFTERTVWRNLMCREKISWTQPLLQSLWTRATGDLVVRQAFLLYFFIIYVKCLGQCAVGVFWCPFPCGAVCSRCDKDIYFRSEWTWEAGTRGRIWSSVRFFQGVVETTVLWKTVKLHQSAISESLCSFIHTVHSEKLHIQIFLFDSSFYWFTLYKIVSLSFLSLLFLVAVRGFNSAGVAAAKTSETATPAAVVVKNSSVSCDADIC